MIPITDVQINAIVGYFVWPFARITGLMSAEPFFSSRSIPRRYRAGFALILTLVLAPLLPPLPATPLVSPAGLAILFEQVLIGLAMGFVMRLILAATDVAGTLISSEMGLSFAMFFDPQSATSEPVLSTLIGIFVTMLFLSFDGPRIVIATLVDSFTVLPIGKTLPWVTWRHLAEWGGQMIGWGLWLSLPVMAALLVTNLAIGVMTRAAPQFNVFSFGFPLTLSIGFIALYLSLPLMAPQVEQLYQLGFSFMLTLLKTAG